MEDTSKVIVKIKNQDVPVIKSENVSVENF
jgi:hypothetical protein